MALGNNSNAAFLNISNGKICRTFKSPKEGAIERVNKNGTTVYEQFFDYVEGVIKNIEAKDGNYGKFWEVELQDDGDTYKLQFNYSSGYANGFLMALPNVDLSQPVRLVPSMKKEGDKTKSTLFINQGGEGIKWFWTKENPGDLPQMVKVKIKGQEQWDDTDRMDYLEAKVKEIMLAHFSAKHNTAAPVAEDDMPF